MARNARFREASGSKVSRMNMRAYQAVKRICEHDMREFSCPWCIAAHPREMGWIETLKVEQTRNPMPSYTEWGRASSVNDLFDSNGVRASNMLRNALAEIFPDDSLSDVIIDFHLFADRQELTIYSGAWREQFWVRLPKFDPNSQTELGVAVERVLTAYEWVQAGRKKEWKRTKRFATA